MSGWQPIRRSGSPDVTGLRDGFRLEVEVPLFERPPAEWIRFFVGSYEEQQRRVHQDHPLPRVEGNLILIAPLDKELQAGISGIDKRIEEANSYYQSTVLPQVEAKERADQEAAEVTARRLEIARRQAQDL